MLILITEVWEGDLIPIAVAGSLAAARARAEEHLRKAGELRALRQGEWEDEEGRIWRWLARMRSAMGCMSTCSSRTRAITPISG